MSVNKKMNKKNSIAKNLVLILTVCIFIVSATISYGKNGEKIWNTVLSAFCLSEKPEKESDYLMGVHFLDVGKADCIYINCGEVNILIDSGDRNVSPSTVEYLNRRGVRKLDLVIASHPHRDHIGQMYNIIDKFDINCFIMSKVPDSITPTSFTYRKMLELLKKKKVNVKLAKPGDRLKIADLTVDILGPCRQYENMNDNSVIAKIVYGSDSFLFMGDAEKNAEMDLINSHADLKATVLKVGHHGSKTSTTEDFLRCVRPNYAVISSGPDRSNLPKQEILDRLVDFKVKTFRTDTMGNITFLTNGNGVNVITEKEAA